MVLGCSTTEVQLPIKVPAEQWRASSDSLKKAGSRRALTCSHGTCACYFSLRLSEVKLDILRRRAGFDFSCDLSLKGSQRPGQTGSSFAGREADGSAPFMRLPMDAMVTGRLLPAARFICMPVPPQDMEDTYAFGSWPSWFMWLSA